MPLIIPVWRRTKSQITRFPRLIFGIILPWAEYELLLTELTGRRVTFVIEHHVRFQGRPGEQATFFCKTPSNNYLEFKAFRNIDMLFAKDLEQY